MYQRSVLRYLLIFCSNIHLTRLPSSIPANLPPPAVVAVSTISASFFLLYFFQFLILIRPTVETSNITDMLLIPSTARLTLLEREYSRRLTQRHTVYEINEIVSREIRNREAISNTRGECCGYRMYSLRAWLKTSYSVDTGAAVGGLTPGVTLRMKYIQKSLSNRLHRWINEPRNALNHTKGGACGGFDLAGYKRLLVLYSHVLHP